MDEAHARRAEGMLRSRGIILFAVVALAAALFVPVSQAGAKQRGGGDIRHVVFVGNNWDGTADVLYPHDHYRRVAGSTSSPTFRSGSWTSIRTRTSSPTSSPSESSSGR